MRGEDSAELQWTGPMVKSGRRGYLRDEDVLLAREGVGADRGWHLRVAGGVLLSAGVMLSTHDARIKKGAS